MDGTGSSRSGRLKSLMSTSSNSASLRFFAISWTHLATASPLRPGRVLPRMMAILSIASPVRFRCFRLCLRVDLRAAGHPGKKLHLPSECDPAAAAMLRKNLGQTRGRRFTGPIALQLALHCHPGHRYRARLDHATHCHLVSLARNATRCVGDNVNLIAFAQRLDCRHSQAYLGPKGSHNHLLSSRLFNGVDDATILPRIDEGPIDRLLFREDVL